MAPDFAHRQTRVRFRTLVVSAVAVSVAVSGCTRVGDVEESRVETETTDTELERPERDSPSTTAAASGPAVSTPTTLDTPVIPETTVASVLGETTVPETTTSQPGKVLSTIADPTTTTPTTAAPTTGTIARPEQQTGSATQTTVATGAGTTGTTTGVQVATTATSAVRAGDAAAETTTSIVSTTQTAETASGTDTTATGASGAATTSGETSATVATGSGTNGGSATATTTESTAEPTTTTAAPETTTTTAAPTTTTTALGTFEELVQVAPNGAPIVADTADAVAQQLLLAERGIRDGTDLQRNAHLQQVAYRKISKNPLWDRTILDAMPESYRASVTRNIEARRAFLSVATYPTVLAQWKIVPPVEGNTLLGYFQEAQDAYGIPWTYLAAMNVVESGMGRIDPYPTFPVGPSGPMQFRPETWAQYGDGGDINDQRDSIMAAARMLAANDFNVDPAKALFAFNPKDAYVTGVTAYARTMTEEPQTFWGYYYWEVYYLSASGDLWFDENYNRRFASSVEDYIKVRPQANP